jgi:hypothetical protein
MCSFIYFHIVYLLYKQRVIYNSSLGFSFAFLLKKGETKMKASNKVYQKRTVQVIGFILYFLIVSLNEVIFSTENLFNKPQKVNKKVIKQSPGGI